MIKDILCIELRCPECKDIHIIDQDMTIETFGSEVDSCAWLDFTCPSRGVQVTLDLENENG